MNPSRRMMMKVLAGLTTGLAASQAALALNPQPEVPSKTAPNEKASPKALNPQPEVPSKSLQDGRTNPKALNPQPEVPSKSKKKSKKQPKKH